jgi:hypothetical protein
MKLTVISSLILVMAVADICHAVDPETTARLGIPVQPQSSGESFSNQGGSGVSVGQGGCGDLGMGTSLGNITNLQSVTSIAQQAVSSVKGMASTGVVAALAYFMPTEYSAAANIMSMAQKQMSVLADKCKAYQAARDSLESKDVSGIRKAAYAKCIENNSGNAVGNDDADVYCSDPANAWQYLSSQFSSMDSSNCVPAIDNVLAGVTLPVGVSKGTLASFFGNFKMCASSSYGTAPTLTADKVYQTNMSWYSNTIDNVVSSAKSSYLSQSDIQTMGLCIGPGNSGIICPHAETINMIASFPDDEQAVFKNKLAEHLSLLQTVYMTYSWSSLLNKAASNAQTPVPDAFTTPVTQMTNQKEKEVNNLVKLKVQASGNDGDLSRWESQVMERNSYWTRLGTGRQNELDAGNILFGSGTVSNRNNSQNNSQSVINNIKNNYSNP